MIIKLTETDRKIQAAIESMRGGAYAASKITKKKRKKVWKKKRKIPYPCIVLPIPKLRPKHSTKKKKDKLVSTIQSILFKKLSFLKFFWYSKKQFRLVRSKLKKFKRYRFTKYAKRRVIKRKHKKTLKIHQLYLKYYLFLLGYRQLLLVPKIPYGQLNLTKYTSKSQYNHLLTRYWALRNLEICTTQEFQEKKYQTLKKKLVLWKQASNTFTRTSLKLTQQNPKKKFPLKRISNLFLKFQTKMFLKKKFRNFLKKKRYLALRKQKTIKSLIFDKKTHIRKCINSKEKLKKAKRIVLLILKGQGQTELTRTLLLLLLQIPGKSKNKRKQERILFGFCLSYLVQFRRLKLNQLKKILNRRNLSKRRLPINSLLFFNRIKKLFKRTPAQSKTYLRENIKYPRPRPKYERTKDNGIMVTYPTHIYDKTIKGPRRIDKLFTMKCHPKKKNRLHVRQPKFLFAWKGINKKINQLTSLNKTITTVSPKTRILFKLKRYKKFIFKNARDYPTVVKIYVRKALYRVQKHNRQNREKQLTARRAQQILKKKIFLKKANTITLLKKLNNIHLKHLISHKLVKKLYTFKLTQPLLKKLSNLFKSYYNTSQIQFFFFFRLFNMMNTQFRTNRISFYKLKKNLYKMSDFTDIETLTKNAIPVLYFKKLAPIRFLKRVFYKSLKQRYYTRRFFKNHELLPIILNCLFKRSSTFYLLSFIGLMLFKFKKHYGVLTHINRFFTYFFRLTSSKAPIMGLKYIIRGRVNGAPRKKNKIYCFGINKTTTFRTGLDYTQLSRETRYGTFGLKMWRYF